MSGHGQVSSGGGLDCSGDASGLSGRGVFGWRNLSKKLKYVLRACNYTCVNTPIGRLSHVYMCD